jgi:uncharacterized protein with HEPN domain
MSKRSSRVLLEDMIDAIGCCQKFILDMSFQDFLKNELVSSAVLRKLEIIGEVARVIPESVKLSSPAIPWHKLKGSRNRIIHEYFDVSFSMVWIIITKELPELKQQLLLLLEELTDD